MVLKIQKILDLKNIDYRLIKLTKPALNINDVIKYSKEQIKRDEVCKTIIIKNKNNKFFGLLLLGADIIDFTKIEKNVGKVNLATIEEVKKITGVSPGAVCPILLQIPIYIDKKILDREKINFGSGHHLYGIEINVKELIKSFKLNISDFSKT